MENNDLNKEQAEKELEVIVESSDENSLTKWIKKNSTRLKILGVILGVGGLTTLIAVLSKNNKELEKQLKYLVQENVFKDMRIEELVNLCNEKDSWVDKILADGLRHGSSLAGQQLAYKKDYLNHIH